MSKLAKIALFCVLAGSAAAQKPLEGRLALRNRQAARLLDVLDKYRATPPDKSPEGREKARQLYRNATEFEKEITAELHNENFTYTPTPLMDCLKNPRHNLHICSLIQVGEDYQHKYRLMRYWDLKAMLAQHRAILTMDSGAPGTEIDEAEKYADRSIENSNAAYDAWERSQDEYATAINECRHLICYPNGRLKIDLPGLKDTLR
jgi:hypothetical protein